jgi:hypothetical protein
MPEQTVDNDKKPKKFWKEKVSRLKLIVLLKNNMLLFSFLAIFALSIFFNVWNISKYEVYDLDGREIRSFLDEQIDKYFTENIVGSNYFTFSPTQYQEDMYIKIEYLKSVKIEKIVPNKITIFISQYSPMYVTVLKSDSCTILSSEGIVLEEICIEEGTECCLSYSKDNELPLFSSSEVDISLFDDDKDRLLIMEDVSKVFQIIESFKFDIVEISLKSDILEFVDSENKKFVFNMAESIDTQIKRYIVVMGKIKSDNMEFQTLDLRFERPVMKN